MSEKSLRLLILVFFIYGAITAVFSAWVMGPVIDEPHYVWIGDQLLDTHDFKRFVDHPPFSPWFGALPSLFMDASNTHSGEILFPCRLVHIALFILGGLFVSMQLFRKASPYSALIFSAIYCCLPSVKGIAAYHLTDFDPGILLCMAAVWLWKSEAISFSKSLRVFFLAGLAAMAKITALLYLPFITVAYYLKAPSKKRLWHSAGFLLGGFLLAALVAYHFQFDQLGGYIESVKWQMRHNQGGHTMSFLGEIHQYGTPLFFIGTFLFKTPFALLILLFWALACFPRKAKEREVWLLFLLPAVLFTLLLSMGSVQLGYRYLIPAVLLILVYCSIALGTTIRQKTGKVAVAICLASLVLVDLRSIASDSYLNYFNLLAPRPTTHNFSDSNNDWGQGIPSHLYKNFPEYKNANSINPVDYLGDTRFESKKYYAGATTLNGLWGPNIGPLLRAIPKETSIAGYDLFELSRIQLFHLLAQRQPVHMQAQSPLKVLSQPLAIDAIEEPSCTSNEKLVIRRKDLLDPPRLTFDVTSPTINRGLTKQQFEASLRKLTPEIPKLQATFNVESTPNKQHLLMVQSDGVLDLSVDGVMGWHTKGTAPTALHWNTFKSSEPFQKIDLEYEISLTAPPKNRFISAVAFWLECEIQLSE